MTKVKKSKKPKARKARKVIVKKTGVVKIDKRLNKAPIIVHEPRSALPQPPLRMFTGQDIGPVFSKQFDVLSSKEQQLESKLINLENELKKEKQDKKNIEIYSEIQDLSIRTNNYINNIGNENYDDIKKGINELLKDKTLDSLYYDMLIDLKKQLSKEKEENIQNYFEEKKETNTLLDDVIVQNELVDEIKEIKKKGRKKKTNTKVDDVIVQNDLVDKQLVVESYLNNPDPLKDIFKKVEESGLLDD